MITVKVPMSGTDKNGKPFTARPGDSVELDEKSEKNYIAEGMAEKAKKSK